MYKCRGKLIGERTRSPSSLSLTELLFADDAAAVGTTRESMERAAHVLEEVTSEWGLSVSVAKTKQLVAGVDCEESDLQPINIRGGTIETVTKFKYLGSIIEANGSVQREVENRISKASRVFSALKRPVFADKDLSLATKRLLYRAIVLGVLLYGAETWPAKRDNSRKLEVFHNRCLRSILGISTSRQRSERISSVQVSQMFGMEESLEDYVSASRLRWLGHLARMDESRLPKRLLFGWLPQPRPAHGPKLRWRDRVRRDLQKLDIAESSWFHTAQDRDLWRSKCRAGLEACTTKRVEAERAKHFSDTTTGNTLREDKENRVVNFVCDTCQRSFKRRQDIARHKCVTTRPRGRRVPQPSQT